MGRSRHWLGGARRLGTHAAAPLIVERVDQLRDDPVFAVAILARATPLHLQPSPS
jgi:hypothetical protein